MIRKILDNRAALMGAMIILIMIFHTRLHYNSHFTQIFAGWGFGGVDGFLFLSALGLFYSFTKDNCIKSFYKKRFVRIIPSYLIIVFFANLLKGNTNLTDILIQVSTIGFWIPHFLNYFDWFVPSLIILYLSFPFYYKFFIKSPRKVTVSFIFVFIVSSLLYALFNNYNINMMYFLCRVPVFLLGVFFAYCNYSKSNFLKNKEFIYTSVLVSIIGFILWFFFKSVLTYGQFNGSTLNWTLFILIIPGFLYVLTLFIESNKLLNKVLSFLGGISLELYLIHEHVIFKYALSLRNFTSTSLPMIFIFLFLSLVSVLLAFAVHKLVSYVILKF